MGRNTNEDWKTTHWDAAAQKIFWTDLLIWCTNLMHRLLYWLYFVVSLVLPRSWTRRTGNAVSNLMSRYIRPDASSMGSRKVAATQAPVLFDFPVCDTV